MIVLALAHIGMRVCECDSRAFTPDVRTICSVHCSNECAPPAGCSMMMSTVRHVRMCPAITPTSSGPTLSHMRVVCVRLCVYVCVCVCARASLCHNCVKVANTQTLSFTHICAHRHMHTHALPFDRCQTSSWGKSL